MTPLTWRDRVLSAGARRFVRPLLALPIPWTLHRAGFDLFAPRPLRRRHIRERHQTFGGVPCLVTEGTGQGAPLLWVHGGGFVMGSAKAYRNLAHAFAQVTGRRVIMPDYRLAPEHPYPAGVDDVVAVAGALHGQGPYVLGGDSAGGTLALSSLAKLVGRGQAPARLVLICPATNLDSARPIPSHREMVLPVPLLRRVVAAYLGAADPRDPNVSPLHAQYKGTPPTLIQCARGEILEGDSDAVATRMAAAGVAVTVQKSDGVPHVWHLFAGYSPEADRAVARIAAFLDEDTPAAQVAS